MSDSFTEFLNRKPSDSVTPTRWRAADGKVYERTGENRRPEPGELCWLDTSEPAPYPFVPSDLPHFPVSPTPIWKLSEDQSWQPPAAPEMSKPDSLDSLIQQVSAMYTGEQLGPVDPLAKMQVLGVLMQARELQRIGDYLDALNIEFRELRNNLHVGELQRLHTAIQHLGGSTPLQTEASGSGQPCRMCRLGEHAACHVRESIAAPHLVCQCPVCWQAPTVSGYRIPDTSAARIIEALQHKFEGMEDNHFCTKCGGGRLHWIHP